MNQNSIFRSTRWRLTVIYTGVISLLLIVCGIGVFEAIAHAHRVTLERELKSVAGTLHDNLESTLKQVGKLEVASQRYLPNLYLYRNSSWFLVEQSQPHIQSPIYQGGYYVRLFDPSGNPIGRAGRQPQGLPITSGESDCQLIEDSLGNRYQEISLPLSLHSPDSNSLWGYLQVGRSWQEFNDYLATVRLIVFWGTPLILLLVLVVSWWLAGIAMQPLYQSYRQIQQFTTDAAHELRTPLAALRATVESLVRMPNFSEAEARDILKVVERQNQRLSELVSDLLFLSRLDRRIYQGERSLCSLQDTIADIEEELAALALEKQVTLTTDIRVQTSVPVMGNEEQLYRMVFNLVANAINYTPAGGRVTIILDYRDNQALIKVRDTGIGIASEELNKIFERFYRVENDRSRSTGGSGLGLPIARAIAKSHQGSIEVQSELGRGSTFTIKLPVSN
ncbi:integral membrane sensor signal transduction histidine kinase (plasmid) [Stanieria cyanosphaera PCC 7437]|uniref:histidine kinase n=1 Tax=Stanieria cyanosphaera (strain ATCC 29371 / PCC 7437) TaxID=111780 RepID=K9Y2I2_STAC7|nr:two-component system sensor histidine kinase RppB [Stanieria cyanosphaera]AFZ38222.1 integral membrane sensor signal transduction histidine kinase [Stanieria cyanosphaera PCC 7437]